MLYPNPSSVHYLPSAEMIIKFDIQMVWLVEQVDK